MKKIRKFFTQVRREMILLLNMKNGKALIAQDLYKDVHRLLKLMGPKNINAEPLHQNMVMMEMKCIR